LLEDSHAMSAMPSLPASKPSVVPTSSIPIRPNRRYEPPVDLEHGGVGALGLTEVNVTSHNSRMSKVNPFVHNFTSPINLAYSSSTPAEPQPRYTFTRH
jgi:hypothetical protein